MQGFLNHPKTRICRECKREFITTKANDQYCETHRGILSKAARWVRNVKDKVYQQYNNRCAHCGFLDKRALQLDHVNGGGTKERHKKRWSMAGVYSDALKHPEKYQILCANCNAIKRHTNNEIPIPTYRQLV